MLQTILACLTLAVVSGCMTTAESQSHADRPEGLVMGYYGSWNAYGGGQALSGIDGHNLTHLLYAFSGMSRAGLAELGDPCADLGACGNVLPGGNFAQLESFKRRYPHVKVLISFGGWTGSEHFSDIAATEEGRRRFVRSAIDLYIAGYPAIFDGIDVDWEYPVRGGLPGNSRRPADRKNFTLLMEEFRRQLDALPQRGDGRYELSIAVSASPDRIGDIEPRRLSGIVDRISVMAYDYHAGSRIAHFNAPLFRASGDPTPNANADASMRAFVAAGVAPSKLVLGVPFYGRTYSEVRNINDGLFQRANPAGAAQWGGERIDYRTLMRNRPLDNGFVSHWSDHARVPFLHNPQTGVWITYDDPQSISMKAAYARQNGYAGVMIWQLGADDGSLLSAVARPIGTN